MAFRANLVNKQFNSPIKLYSAENIADTLEKQKQILANGAVGIDFHHLAKPGNLANSAVLRMLEEEEVNRSRITGGLKRVAWPPPPEDNPEVNNEEEPQFQQPVYSQGLTGAAKGQQPVAVQQPPNPLRTASNLRYNNTEEPPNNPTPLGKIRSPSPYHPVHFEPPKTTVTLLQTAPIRQEPPPVYVSQPVTATVKGGVRMRGDQKWPPENVKQQTAAENEARIALAKGPACRPRKVKKDYSSFFAQHALNSTYPGYRAPPGTQHYTEGASDF